MRKPSFFRPLAALALAGALLLTACGDTSDEATLVLSNRTTDGFASVKVENQAGGYTVALENGQYTCAALEGLPGEETAFAALAQGCTTLEADEIVSTSRSDRAQYGLDSPAAKATITYTDGVTLTLLVGRAAPQGGLYFAVQGQNQIYLGTAPVLETLLAGPAAFYSLTLTATADPYTVIGLQQGDTTLSLSLLDAPVTDGYGNSFLYQMAGSDDVYVDPTAFTSYFGNCGVMRASSVLCRNPDAQALAGYGLDDPQATLTLGAGRQRQTFYVGYKADDYTYYVMAPDTGLVYLVSSRYISFDGVSEHALISRYIAAPPASQVASIQVVTPGIGDFYVIDIFEDYCMVDGMKLEARTYTGLYRLLCSLQAEYQLEAPAINTNVGSVSIVFFKTDGTKLTVKLVPLDTKRYSIWIDQQEAQYAVRAAFCEKLLSTLSQITNGQIIDPVW